MWDALPSWTRKEASTAVRRSLCLGAGIRVTQSTWKPGENGQNAKAPPPWLDRTARGVRDRRLRPVGIGADRPVRHRRGHALGPRTGRPRPEAGGLAYGEA